MKTCEEYVIGRIEKLEEELADINHFYDLLNDSFRNNCNELSTLIEIIKRNVQFFTTGHSTNVEISIWNHETNTQEFSDFKELLRICELEVPKEDGE